MIIAKLSVMEKCLVILVQKVVTKVIVIDVLIESIEEGAGQEEIDLESVEEEEKPGAQVCLW